MKIKENNKKNYLNQQGITLIALVITIIVLLILAAVTINAIFGENGLIKQIDIAKEKNAIAEYVDDLNRKLLEARINVANDESKILEETKRLVAEDEKYNEATIGEIEGDNKFTVITKEGYEIDVKKDGATYVDKVTETAQKVKLTVKHINKSGTELKATTETEYDKDTAVTVKSETISGYKTYSARITATEVNETLTEGAPVELSFGIYMDTEVVITYDVLQSGETEKEYEEKPTVSNSTEPVRVKPVEKDSSIKDSLPTDIKNSDNSYMVDIEPVKSNSGPLTITLDVSNKAEDGDTANVRHYKNSAWDDLGDFIVAEGKITFTIDSFSPFCITIKKKGSSTGGEIEVSKGAFVEYNVAYKDAYKGYDYTATNGWRLLDYTKNEDGTYSNVKLISTGVPARLYYYFNDITNSSWYVTDSTKLTNFKNVLGSDYQFYKRSGTYYSLQASAGMYENFGNIKFAYGASNREKSLGWFTEITSNGITYNSTNTTETTGSNLFIPTGVNAKVRLLTLPEMNKMLGRTDIDSTTTMTDPTGADGLFVLQNIQNITGMSSNTYDTGSYWLASPSPGAYDNDGVCKVNYDGYVGRSADTLNGFCGVRPVVSLESNIQLTDNGNGVLKID